MSKLVYNTIKKLVLNLNSQRDSHVSKNTMKKQVKPNNIVNIKSKSLDITRTQRFWDCAVLS